MKVDFGMSSRPTQDHEQSAGHVRHAVRAEPSFVPPSLAIPEDWPSRWNWIGTARHNALDLFPQACFQDLLTTHSVFGQRLVVLSDPATIAEVNGSAASNYSLTNMHLRMLGPALGKGVIVAEGVAWRRQRRAAIQIVSAANDRAISSFTEDRIAAQISAWQSAPGPVAIQSDLSLLAIDLLAAELFHHHQTIGDSRVLDAIGRHRTLVERADLLDIIGAPPWMKTPRLWRAKRLIGSFDNDIHNAIAQSSKFAPPAGFDAGAQRDLVVNLMSGFESIATTALWLLGLVATHEPLLHWLTDPDISAAERAERMASAVAETLRLYPPLPLIYRQARAAHETRVGIIPAGAMVCISPYVVQRHARLWQDPHRFDPARVMPAAKVTPYMPFGLGARQCVGRQIGPRISALIVSAALSSLRPRLNGSLPVPRAGLSLRPATPLMMAFDHA